MSPVQRVRRVVRKIDPWTVLKVSFVFNSIMSLALVLGTLIFWSVFVNAGIPDKISDLAQTVGFTVTLDGPTYFRIVILLAIIFAILMTGLATLAAVVYNLISDLVGGIEVVVLEETLLPHAVRGPQASTGSRDEAKPIPPQIPPVRPARPAKPVPAAVTTGKGDVKEKAGG
ncbi:MAG: DUF3566 domain-containing protein [Acidimicrobiia bacterium]